MAEKNQPRQSMIGSANNDDDGKMNDNDNDNNDNRLIIEKIEEVKTTEPSSSSRLDKSKDTTTTTTTTTNTTNSSNKKKRKRPYGESLIAAYSSVSFEPIKSAEVVEGDSNNNDNDHNCMPPDSPNFFFSSSYNVTSSLSSPSIFSPSPSEATRVNTRGIKIQQIVHQHINGLCVVTAGQLSNVIPSSLTLKSIRFVAKEAPPSSAAMKRKRQTKMLKGGKVDDVVHPSTVIAELILEENNNSNNNNNNDKEIQEKEIIIIPLYACVWGTIIELNNRNESLTPKVLLDDPLLDGHIAIILPSGKFPPERTS
jgi:hypothetical protein